MNKYSLYFLFYLAENLSLRIICLTLFLLSWKLIHFELSPPIIQLISFQNRKSHN